MFYHRKTSIMTTEKAPSIQKKSVNVCFSCFPEHTPSSALTNLITGLSSPLWLISSRDDSNAQKDPSSPARETINLSLMSNNRETTASKRAINNSPARVYTRSLTTRAGKRGHVHPNLRLFQRSLLYKQKTECRSRHLRTKKHVSSEMYFDHMS